MSAAETDPNSDTNPAPRRAAVAPRATRDGSSAKLPIERLLLPLIESSKRGLIVITAPRGGGKTTAVRHLRAVLPTKLADSIFDADQASQARAAALQGVAILARTSVDSGWTPLETFALSLWGTDDCLEYLACVHRQHCTSVLNRLRADPAHTTLGGSPQLLAAVMDRMAGNPSILTVSDALRGLVADLVTDPSTQETLLENWTRHVCGTAGVGAMPDDLPKNLNSQQQVWWRHEPVRRILASGWIVDQLAYGQLPGILAQVGSPSLISDIASAARGRPAAVACLNELVAGDRKSSRVPMAASLLIQIDPNWRPANCKKLNLGLAKLTAAKWAGVEIPLANLNHADLSRANLRGAKLSQANLRNAVLAGADLSCTNLESSHLEQADFSEANLSGAILNQSFLDGSILERASLRRAELCKASLVRARINEADFSGAIMDGVRAEHLRMDLAVWTGATFRQAHLVDCNLEGLDLPSADFTDANLSRSLLTGTRIHRGLLRGVNLRQTGLSDIDWQHADLRDADFTEASFHLGSTRSGLVGSTIAGEGSKTGFYTDELNDQDFKSPEEIRKACLCGADLRGAQVEGTDFYLVDLRGAKYTAPQAKWFARCGAILHSRVA